MASTLLPKNKRFSEQPMIDPTRGSFCYVSASSITISIGGDSSLPSEYLSLGLGLDAFSTSEQTTGGDSMGHEHIVVRSAMKSGPGS